MNTVINDDENIYEQQEVEEEMLNKTENDEKLSGETEKLPRWKNPQPIISTDEKKQLHQTSQTKAKARFQVDHGDKKMSFYDVVRQRMTLERLFKNVRHFLQSNNNEKKKNLNMLREKTKSKVFPEVFTYKPKVSEEFLEEWLDFPTHYRWTLWNTFTLPSRWLLWTNKSIVGLDPSNRTIRERLCNSISVLGTAAGLFIVIAVAGLLQPPGKINPPHLVFSLYLIFLSIGSNSGEEISQFLLDLFGFFMFTSFVSFLFYIGFALTALYPVLQSLRDDIAFDAYEKLMKRWGGYELYLFNGGFQLLIAGVVTGCWILYSEWVVIGMIGAFILVYGATVFLSREMYLALDPTTAMHLGLSNKFDDRFRAELLSRYFLEKIPNSLLKNEKVFKERRESDIYRERVLQATTTTHTQIDQKMLLLKMKEERKKSLEFTAAAMKSMTSEIPTDVVAAVTDIAGKCLNHRPFTAGVPIDNQPTSSSDRDRLPMTISDQLHHRAQVAQQKVALDLQKSQPTRKSVLLLPALPELKICFTDAKFLPTVLPKRDCEDAFFKLEAAGCFTISDFITFLNETKVCGKDCICGVTPGDLSAAVRQDKLLERGRPSSSITTSRPFTAQDSSGPLVLEDVDSNRVVPINNEDFTDEVWIDYSSLHATNCPTRLAACWIASLEKMRIPIFPAQKILLFFKPYLH